MITSLLVPAAPRVILPQVSEALFDRMDRSFGSMAELPSNVEAIDAALQFATGANSFVAIVGPTGWGKSHLLDSVSNHLSRESRCKTPRIRTLDWLEGRSAASPNSPLVIDDAHDATSRSRCRIQLQLALERRVRTGRPTLIALTGEKLTRNRLAFLPSLREWSVHEIGQPSPTERRAVVRQMARAERIRLADVLIDLIALRMMGNGNTILGALNRLKLASPSWISSEEILHACGILDPFFADNSGWDFQEKVMTAAKSTAQDNRQALQMACYALIQVAGLSEVQVACMAGIPPRQARTDGLAIREAMRTESRALFAYRQFLEITVESLLDS